jgi:hypothetical protein
MAMGQAAGAAISVARERGVALDEIPINELQALLIQHGAILD